MCAQPGRAGRHPTASAGVPLVVRKQASGLGLRVGTCIAAQGDRNCCLSNSGCIVALCEKHLPSGGCVCSRGGAGALPVVRKQALGDKIQSQHMYCCASVVIVPFVCLTAVVLWRRVKAVTLRQLCAQPGRAGRRPTASVRAPSSRSKH